MVNPHDLYIRFLITKGLLELKGVNEALSALSLPNCTNSCFIKQLSFVEICVPKGIFTQIQTKRYSVDFMKWMRDLNIEEFWLADPFKAKDYPGNKKDYDAVIAVHTDPALRISINCLTYKKIPIPDLIRIISARYTINLKESQVALYLKYFFNVEFMSRADWRLFISTINNEKESYLYKVALSEPIDVLKTELDLPAQVNVSEALQKLLTKSLKKAHSNLDADTPTANKEARAWINQIVILTEKYEKYRSADQTDFAKSLQLQFDYIEEEFPTPDKETLAHIEALQKKREDESKANKLGLTKEETEPVDK